jgi:membrane associated rhomboid family serine protease
MFYWSINISIFFIINISTGSVFSHSFIAKHGFPLNLNEFVFKFWTLFTYMFSHKDLGHIFYNMLLLVFLSTNLSKFHVRKKISVRLYHEWINGWNYITNSICHFFPSTFEYSILFGASAAVLGIVTALALYIPNLTREFFGIIEMKYKYYALLIFAVSTIIDFNINTGGKISHFGGAFFGLLFGYHA